jgi:hypothetical protein
MSQPFLRGDQRRLAWKPPDPARVRSDWTKVDFILTPYPLSAVKALSIGRGIAESGEDLKEAGSLRPPTSLATSSLPRPHDPSRGLAHAGGAPTGCSPAPHLRCAAHLPWRAVPGGAGVARGPGG